MTQSVPQFQVSVGLFLHHSETRGNVGAALTLGSNDAAILHGQTSDLFVACATDQMCASQAQILGPAIARSQVKSRISARLTAFLRRNDYAVLDPTNGDHPFDCHEAR